MNKSLILSFSLFAFLAVSAGQASSTGQNSDLVEKSATAKKTIIASPSFDQSLVPAELPFIEHCKYKGIKVNWKLARKDFLRAVKYSPNNFEIEAYQHIPITDINFKNKEFQHLYDQYKDFYNNWYGLDSEQKENKKPVVITASSSSCSSSSSSTPMISTTVEGDHDADTAHSATTPLLRQRQPAASTSSTVEVK